MDFDFETPVDHRGLGNLKEEYTPQAIRAAGLPSYWGAEFDFKTAPAIIEAVRRAADNGLFGFTLMTGAYVDRVVWWFETQRRAALPSQWILPTHGVIYSLATSIRAFSKEGEGVIVLTPGYGRHRQAAERLGRRVVESRLLLEKGRYRVDFKDLETKMAAPQNRLLVLCNPNNPTGTIWGRAELETIAAMALRHGTAVFSDEIFAEVAFGGAIVPPYYSVAGAASRSVTCSSLGKSFGLTGVNHANVVIPEPAMRESFLIQRNADHYGSIDPFLHAALLGAYTEEGAAWLAAMRDYVWGNYKYIDGFFRENLPAVRVIEPEGTYVLWIDFRGLGLGPEELSRFLVEEALLCLDRGEEYGGYAGWMRMNISAPRRGSASPSKGFSRPLAPAASPRGRHARGKETSHGEIRPQGQDYRRRLGPGLGRGPRLFRRDHRLRRAGARLRAPRRCRAHRLRGGDDSPGSHRLPRAFDGRGGLGRLQLLRRPASSRPPTKSASSWTRASPGSGT